MTSTRTPKCVAPHPSVSSTYVSLGALPGQGVCELSVNAPASVPFATDGMLTVYASLRVLFDSAGAGLDDLKWKLTAPLPTPWRISHEPVVPSRLQFRSCLPEIDVMKTVEAPECAGRASTTARSPQPRTARAARPVMLATLRASGGSR